MITVIDMASGKLICSSTATEIDTPVTLCRSEFPMTALALQEVQAETVSNVMPPEFVDIPAAAIITMFE